MAQPFPSFDQFTSLVDYARRGVGKCDAGIGKKPHGPGDAFRLGNIITGTEDDDSPGGLTHRGVDDAWNSLIPRMTDADDRDIGREVPQGFVDLLAGFIRRGVVGDDQFQWAICLLRHRTYGLNPERLTNESERRLVWGRD